jgi:hypothetical protein
MNGRFIFGFSTFSELSGWLPVTSRSPDGFELFALGTSSSFRAGSANFTVSDSDIVAAEWSEKW